MKNKTKNKVLIILLLFTILEFGTFFFPKNILSITENLGNWSVYVVLVIMHLPMLVLLLLFLDGKFTSKKSQNSLTNPIPTNDDKKLGDYK